MSRARTQAVALAVAVATFAAATAATAASTASAQGRATTTLRHAESGFAIQVPRGFRLTVSRGVYVLRSGAQTMSFSRSKSALTAQRFGAELLQQLGGRVVRRSGSAKRFAAQVNRGRGRETIVVVRSGDENAVTTSTSPRRRPVSLRAVRRVAASARGGYVLSPPAASAPVPLTPYRAPDGGATATVPQGWDVQSAQGSIQGSGRDGAFLLGFSTNPFLPETAPPGTPQGILVAPYLRAADALVQILPRLSSAVTDIRVRSLVADAPLPSFTSSGMFAFDYTLAGEAWVGVATVGTDDPSKYSNYVWGFYYSGIGVRVGSAAGLGSALVQVWNSWNPSGAIAQRSAQAKALIAETNAVWQEVGEFRRATADRQARDVGCLLQGHYVIEDDSRKYDLPPAPCGQQYVPGDG